MPFLFSGLGYNLYNIVVTIERIVEILIIIRVLLSWVNFSNSLADIVYTLTEPLLKPFRNLLYSLLNLPIDLSPVLFLIVFRTFIRFLLKILFF